MLGLVGATIDIFDPSVPAGKANDLSAFLGLNVVVLNIIGDEEQQRPFKRTAFASIRITQSGDCAVV